MIEKVKLEYNEEKKSFDLKIGELLFYCTCRHCGNEFTCKTGYLYMCKKCMEKHNGISETKNDN